MWLMPFAIIGQTDWASYVNPMVGTGGHGHTFPGATVPFGMVQVSPDTRVDGSWDGCSGYHQSDNFIYGFSHTHLSGTGCSDYGDIMIMPSMGKTSFDNKEYGSAFSHSTEKTEPGYYAVQLSDDDISVEVTTTTRVAIHRYKFNKDGKVNIVLDLNHRDKLQAGVIKMVSGTVLETYRVSEAWAKEQKIYARIEFSKSNNGIVNPPEETFPPKDPWNKTIKTAVQFNVKKGDSLLVKVAISPVSMPGARFNMVEELKFWDFEKIKTKARASWNKELGKIEVSGINEERKKIFYTALYHCMIHPSISMDADSTYRGFDDQTAKATHSQYTVFSLWDTFRALHPLFTIIDMKRTNDFINSFLSIYEKGGRLPVWELASRETDCMIGYHSVSVIADAFVKGIKGFDENKALEAMKKSANWNHLGLPAYRHQGFLAVEDESENVSKTLEYAYDDWCISQMALFMNRVEEYEVFSRRAMNWRNMLDPETGHMRPKSNGNWLAPFDATRVDNNFTEANAWQYSFFVPHDITGLIEMMGGPARFESKLDELFSTSSQTTGREQADITGLIGQYAHGNEPSHHIAYLYNFIGKPWKTQERVQQILKNFYTTGNDGLIGNEDCGQMSAWLVFSAMGFYPVTPGMPIYQIGTPWFSQVKLNLENGKTFIIKGNDVSEKNFYIQYAKLNGEDHPRSWIEHKSIMAGGTFEFQLGSNPSLSWGAESQNLLEFRSLDKPLNPVPIIELPGRTFRDSALVNIKTIRDGNEVLFTLDGLDPGPGSPIYAGPFWVNKDVIIKAVAINEDGSVSYPVTGRISKIKNPDWTVSIQSKYNAQYTAGGDQGIIDGLRGEKDWRKGGWQGYQAQDMVMTVDFKKEKLVQNVGAGFLQDTRSWILLPKKVVFEISMDGINFTTVAEISDTVPDKELNISIRDFSKTIKPVPAKYLRVKAINYGTLPVWHQGAGGEAFIFSDEVWAE